MSDNMDYDDLLKLIGPFGKYQKLIVFLVLQPALFPCAFLYYNAVFLAATPSDYWCHLPLPANTTTETLRSSLLPVEERNGENKTSHCRMFDFNYSSLSYSNNGNFVTPSDSPWPEVSCQNGWEFDQSVYEDTVVTEYNLVCDQHLAATISFALTSLGGVVGTLLWGFLADRWGRKPTYFSLIVFQTVFSFTTGFSPNFTVYCLCRFFVGSTLAFSYTLPYLLSIELTGVDTRVLMSVICSAGYTISAVMVVGIAYMVRTWRMLNFISASLMVFTLGLWSVFPESPRWLLSQGRYSEVESFIRKVSRINKKPLPKEIDTDLPRILEEMNTEKSDENVQKHSMLDLFRSPNMRKKTLILVFVNFCNVGVFHGLNYYAPEFGENPHLNSLLSGLIEFPPYLFATFVCQKFGRRASLVVGMTIAAISSLVAVGVPSFTSATSVIMALSLTTKFFVTLTFMIGELLEEEIFPTVVRGEGASLTIILSSVAGCAAPFVVHLGHNLLVLPLAVFGGLCLLAAGLALFLPETVGTDLPQTLSDGEQMGKDMTWKEIFSLRMPASKKRKTQLTDVISANGFDKAHRQNTLPSPEETVLLKKMEKDQKTEHFS